MYETVHIIGTAYAIKTFNCTAAVCNRIFSPLTEGWTLCRLFKGWASGLTKKNVAG